MLKHIFYLLTLLPIIWEAIRILDPVQVSNFSKKVSSDTTPKEEKSLLGCYSFLQFGYITWAFIGLFSFQWPLFLVLFVLGLIPNPFIITKWIDALISLCVLILIVLNAYHFHITPMDIIDINFFRPLS